MKYTLLIIISLLILSSCSEQGKNGSGTSLTNTISLTDNSTTYTDTIVMKSSGEGGAILSADSADKMNSAKQNFITQCIMTKEKEKSFFTFSYNNPSISFPVSFTIDRAEGPASGVGIFKTNEVDTLIELKAPNGDTAVVSGNLVSGRSTYTEAAKEGHEFSVDSAIVDIKKADGKTIVGTYQLWLSNASGKKAVTGTINWNSAMIN